MVTLTSKPTWLPEEPTIVRIAACGWLDGSQTVDYNYFAPLSYSNLILLYSKQGCILILYNIFLHLWKGIPIIRHSPTGPRPTTPRPRLTTLKRGTTSHSSPKSARTRRRRTFSGPRTPISSSTRNSRTRRKVTYFLFRGRWREGKTTNEEV